MLDGACDVDKLCERAKELGMPAVAMTDHGNIFGAVHFVNAAKQAGIKPIIGCELYICKKDDHNIERTPPDGDTYNHLLVLAENEEGYRNLVKITSEASLHGFYYKPRVSKRFLAEHSKGLIGLSGCLKGEVAERLMEEKYEAARDAAVFYRDIFGKDNFFLEIQDQGLELEHRIHSESVSTGKGTRPADGGDQRQPLPLRRRCPRAGCDAVHSDRKVDPGHQPDEVPGHGLLRQEPRRNVSRLQGRARRAFTHHGNSRALQHPTGKGQQSLSSFRCARRIHASTATSSM